jgi:hypothetical protein
MTTEITVTKSFEERMMNMMKENVGTLFTPDDLKKIVEKGIEKMFFEKRTTTSAYSYREETKNSLSEELIIRFMQDQVRIAVGGYIRDNPEKILVLINKLMSEGMGNFILKSLETFFQQSFLQFGDSIKQQIQNMPR